MLTQRASKHKPVSNNLAMTLITNPGNKITEDKLEIVEKQIGYPFPNQYRQFLLVYNGGRPVPDCFQITLPDKHSFRSAVYKFYEAEELLTFYRDYLLDYVDYFGLTKDYVEPEYLYHIGECLAGAICIAVAGRHQGKIYYTDNGDFGIIYQSACFDDFIKEFTL